MLEKCRLGILLISASCSVEVTGVEIGLVSLLLFWMPVSLWLSKNEARSSRSTSPCALTQL